MVAPADVNVNCLDGPGTLVYERTSIGTALPYSRRDQNLQAWRYLCFKAARNPSAVLNLPAWYPVPRLRGRGLIYEYDRQRRYPASWQRRHTFAEQLPAGDATPGIGTMTKSVDAYAGADIEEEFFERDIILVDEILTQSLRPENEFLLQKITQYR